MDLVETYRNAEKSSKHRAGGVTLVCLDDSSLNQSDYGRMGDRTIVPRSRDEGGIMGLALGNDCKYGKGVTRRNIIEDDKGNLKVESEEDNFRPDHAYEALDLFSEEMLQEAGVEIAEEVDPLAMLQKQAAHALQNPASAQQNGNADNSVMVQMMGLMSQMVANQGAPAKVAAPKIKPKPTTTKAQVPTKDVIFSGEFGEFTVQYSGVVIQEAFVVLISKPNQPTVYKPPLSSQKPINIGIDGQQFKVMNLGLSFNHKGDILLLMPLALNTEDPNAEQTE
jgi:hypothetical protein